eukprot:Plantae.Rhodophyta-Hildenbrandia_rubra.ctg16625.p1 GENE.Plantae.Rhodophyta-Hildenbrandia_rubra.ctg16625~~Plantae.Rhodophyta-Hildenbrandia_rubra.ctg16625.p1  ORF type:complete len:319 (+),score=68.19 Plantae.Rhodophyta-Hildenbrandia_rubra.ctg16625:1455-2411(+)
MTGAKRPRSTTANGAASASAKRPRTSKKSSSGTVKASVIRKTILDTAKSSTGGVSFQEICEALPAEVSHGAVVEVLNKLSGKRLSLFKDKNGSPLWKWVDEVEMKKFRGLTRDQMMIYEEVKKAGNMGLTKKDIKNRTNFLTTEITKLTGMLMKKELIKLVQVVPSKNRKVYMLVDVEPSSAITGGPWYNDELEYDLEFITVLYKHVLEFVKEQRFVSVKDVADFVKKIKISNEELSEKDIESLLDTMVFDGYVEYCKGNGEAHVLLYRLALPMPSVNSLSEVPCGVCPLRKECKPDGRISPATCKYMDDWLETVMDW